MCLLSPGAPQARGSGDGETRGGGRRGWGMGLSGG